MYFEFNLFFFLNTEIQRDSASGVYIKTDPDRELSIKKNHPHSALYMSGIFQFVDSMAKKSSPIFPVNFLYTNGHDFSDIL